MTAADLIVTGAGPTGLAAAIYAAREEIKTLVLERDVIAGGLVAQTAIIDNYPGFPDGIEGPELGERLLAQAKRFGVEVITGQDAVGLVFEAGALTVKTAQDEFKAKAVLVASGNHYRKLGLDREKELTGRGVHYCATCDGPLYKDKRLAVVGGGNSAMQEGLFLTKFATHIDMLVRGDSLKGTELLREKVTAHPKITIHYHTELVELSGAQKLENLKAVDNRTGKVRKLLSDGVFIFIGLLPNTDWLKGTLELDSRGFVATQADFKTSLDGVFAAGDVRSGATFQIASAVGEGVSAALKVRDYLEKLREKTPSQTGI